MRDFVFLLTILLLFANGLSHAESTAGTTLTIDPTYYNIAVLSDWVPDGGAQIFIVFPKAPIGHTINPAWSGSARPRILQELSVDSVYFEDISTGLRIEAIPSSAEMGLALLRASGNGYFSVSVRDDLGLIKPSMPLLFEIIPSGDSAVEWQIRGPKAMNYPSDFSIHWAVATDITGRPVPSAFPGMVTSVVRVKIASESTPDSSARVANAFDRTPTFEVNLTGFHGIFPFIVTNNQPETVTVIAEGVGSSLSASDSFQIIFQDDPANLLVIPASGIRATQSAPLPLLAAAFSNGLPEPFNYSTKVRLRAIDLSGLPSTTVSPPNWQTLVGGVFGFSFQDSEPDTDWVFVLAETDSLPHLETPIKTPIQVVPPDRAVKLRIDMPVVAFVRDTVKISIEAVNSSGGVDLSHNGWFILSVQGDDDLVVFDSSTGETWSPLELADLGLPLFSGRRNISLSKGTSGGIHLMAEDAEIIGMFDNSLLLPSSERSLSFETPTLSGAISYNFQALDDDYFPAGRELVITVTARDGTGEIDSSYYGTAAVLTSARAHTIPSDGFIGFTQGIANFAIVDSFTESVEIEVSGALFPDSLRLSFIRTGEGGVLSYAQDYSWIPLGATRNIRVVVFGESFIETSFYGSSFVTIIEPDGDGSVSAPDSVSLIAGLGYFPLSNTEIEAFTVNVSGPPEIGSTSFPLESRARVNFSFPAFAQIGAAFDSIRFTLSDFYGAYYSANCTMIVIIDEEFDNSSVFYDSLVIFYDGLAYFIFENSEPELISLHAKIPPRQLLYMDSEEVGEWEYYLGSLPFVACDIDEAKLPRNAEIRIFPNPFNSSVAINLSGFSAPPDEIEIFDIAGRRIARIPVEAHRAVSSARFIWQPEEQPSGVYLFRAVQADGKAFCRKAVYLK